jgi:hypothetical protein
MHFKSLLFEFLALAILMLLIPFFISIDITVLENQLSEISITEFMQEIFIFIVALIFYRASKKHLESKGLFILMAGLFSMMFIREGDYYLDVIYHGFWKLPVAIVLITTVYFAYQNRHTIMQPMLTHMESKPFTYIFIGFMIIVIFSRVFGTGNLWREIMGENYLHLYKTIIQEGLELFGYSLLFYGSVLFYLRAEDA